VVRFDANGRGESGGELTTEFVILGEKTAGQVRQALDRSTISGFETDLIEKMSEEDDSLDSQEPVTSSSHDLEVEMNGPKLFREMSKTIG
jgi:hypothetical protein